ncbi:hypothetical protein A2U01_0051593, partial [Trifolium medium]|nr:hypothetical protein [Trifolium medium]
MTIPANNVDSSSSATPTEVSGANLSAFENLAPLELILSYIEEGISSGTNGERGIRNRGLRTYLIRNEDDDDSNGSADET